MSAGLFMQWPWLGVAAAGLFCVVFGLAIELDG